MFGDLSERYPWVFPSVPYNSLAEVGSIVEEQIVPSCEEYIAKRDRSPGRLG
jgi:hypothetical protein